MLTGNYPQIDLHYEGGNAFLSFIAITLVVIMILLHIACGIGIMESARRYSAHHGATVLLGGGMWSLVGFLSGPVGLGLYWVVHLSTLNPAQAAPAPQPPPAPGA